MARHNNIVERVKIAALRRFEKIAENQVVGSERLRPDLIIRKGNKMYIIDVTFPFDNGKSSLDKAAKEKTDKYDNLRRELESQYKCVPNRKGVFSSEVVFPLAESPASSCKIYYNKIRKRPQPKTHSC